MNCPLEFEFSWVDVKIMFGEDLLYGKLPSYLV